MLLRAWDRYRSGQYRVGRFTTGGVLVLLGLMLNLDRWSGWEGTAALLSYWPVVLIAYGAEALLVKREDRKISYDVSGAFLVFLVCSAIAVTAFTGSLIRSVAWGGAKVEGDPIVTSASGLKGLDIRGTAGRITLEPSQDGQVTVTPVYHTGWGKRTETRRPDLKIRPDGGTLLVSSEIPSSGNWFSDKNSGVDLYITAPPSLLVEVSNEVGEISISGFDQVKSVSGEVGRISLKDSKGRADVRLSVGAIDIEGFTGGLTVDHEVGRIRASGEPDQDWDFATELGSVEVDVPENGSYRYTFSSELGSVDRHGNQFDGNEGSLNGGTHGLTVRTSVGSVDVRTH
ncbi:DUF4097 domain-containing protein [Paenibacillus sp. CC-CFT747]|nr:DUF4097 domain-containing protein [Paenibacillus sp. CC-CFT747]